MKSMIAVLVLVLAIAGYFVSGMIGSSNPASTQKTEEITSASTTNYRITGKNAGDYKSIGSDKDDTVETNNALMIQLAQLQKQVSSLANDNQEKNTVNTTDSASPKSDLSRNVEKIIHKGKAAVNDVLKKTNVVNYQINGESQTNNVFETQNNYIWTAAILSDAKTSTVEITTNKKSKDNKSKEKAIPKFTIAENSIFETINTTALIGRIPSSGEVNNPYRFSLKIQNTHLFANYHKHNNLDGIIVSGTASGDLLLSCVRASIDSVTYIFDDGTISQNNGVELATITDKYGYPCIKGELVTNAPQYIATSSILSGLASAAQAIADTQNTTTTDASGNTTSQLTGNSGKQAAYSALSGVTGETQKWVNDRAKSSFDAIVASAGQQIQLFFNKQVEIDYDKNGRKLVYKNTNSRSEYANFD